MLQSQKSLAYIMKSRCYTSAFIPACGTLLRIMCRLVTTRPLGWAPAVIGHLDVVIQQNVGKRSLDLVSGGKPG